MTAGEPAAPREGRVYRYRIDFEGRVFHAGTQIDDAAVIRQLLRKVHRDTDGTCFSLCAGERNELSADDVLYVIAGWAGEAVVDAEGRLAVVCQGGLRRALDLRTLWMRDESFLYGAVEDGFAARFGRQAWLGFAERFIREQQGAAVVRIGAEAFPVVKHR